MSHICVPICIHIIQLNFPLNDVNNMNNIACLNVYLNLFIFYLSIYECKLCSHTEFLHLDLFSNSILRKIFICLLRSILNVTH